ncbi:RNA methyltransferase [Curvivirga aplysinae]|uniref:RNA methyltransferase n=1 Tax=Curvivirga aplysinae TaxID=2529852 RepID=UPI0012BC07AD|nr:RNA methyltransferase [Curvivirga aplysinae]MTI09829.1 RNA methyltransferase [Curvivirga aplysinae]
MTNKPVIILVIPQLGENIGMVARAMLNCGLTELRLVNPRDGWPSQSARDASSGAIEVIEGAKLFESTADAVADLTYVYATTGRPRDMVAHVVTPKKAAVEIHEKAAQGQTCGILFGGERSGLNNDDVALADAIVNVPLNPDFKSLNLAQAVLLLAYEWYQHSDDTPESYLEINDSQPVSQGEFNNFISRLEKGLDQGGFFRSPDMKPVVMRNIRNLFQRAQMTEQETRTFHGMMVALKRAGLEIGDIDKLRD